jgi:hypothetical protein
MPVSDPGVTRLPYTFAVRSVPPSATAIVA